MPRTASKSSLPVYCQRATDGQEAAAVAPSAAAESLVVVERQQATINGSTNGRQLQLPNKLLCQPMQKQPVSCCLVSVSLLKEPVVIVV